jgi:hypothetical protein
MLRRSGYWRLESIRFPRLQLRLLPQLTLQPQRPTQCPPQLLAAGEGLLLIGDNAGVSGGLVQLNALRVPRVSPPVVRAFPFLQCDWNYAHAISNSLLLAMLVSGWR